MRRQDQLQLTGRRRRRAPRPPRQRGAGLFDALVAMTILAFGMLAMTKFQARLVAQGTEAQTRMAALQLADELVNLAIVDPNNAGCYTVPPAGACASEAARAMTDAWAERVRDALPGETDPTSTVAADGQLTVVINWDERKTGDETPMARQLTAVSDVRP